MTKPKTILVTNTAPHPAMRIPPGGRGQVRASVVELCDYLVPVETSAKEKSSESATPEATEATEDSGTSSSSKSTKKGRGRKG